MENTSTTEKRGRKKGTPNKSRLVNVGINELVEMLSKLPNGYKVPMDRNWVDLYKKFYEPVDGDFEDEEEDEEIETSVKQVVKEEVVIPFTVTDYSK